MGCHPLSTFGKGLNPRLYNYQLSRNVGAEGLVLLTVLVQTSAGLRERHPIWVEGS